MPIIPQLEVTPSDEVTLLIEREEFTGWESVDINLWLDAYASVGFSAPFQADQKEFREAFRPFSFKPLELLVDDKTLFNGTSVGINPASAADKSVVGVSGYSLPGVLQDCNEPPSALPTEFKRQNLRDIAQALAAPFGLEVDFRAPVGALFDKVKLDITGAPHDFLAKLAKQRNIVLSSNQDGGLLCWQSEPPGRPVARLKDFEEPVTNVSATFSPQAYFSEITGFATPRKGRKGSKFTAPNPFLESILRPNSFELGDTETGDAEEATRAKLGRMFANMAAYTVEVATWRDPQGKLWEPNTTVTLNAPNAMVYGEFEFLIRSVTLHQDKDKTTASLGLVMPGAFSGETPEALPWEE